MFLIQFEIFLVLGMMTFSWNLDILCVMRPWILFKVLFYLAFSDSGTGRRSDTTLLLTGGGRSSDSQFGFHWHLSIGGSLRFSTLDGVKFQARKWSLAVQWWWQSPVSFALLWHHPGKGVGAALLQACEDRSLCSPLSLGCCVQGRHHSYLCCFWLE